MRIFFAPLSGLVLFTVQPSAYAAASQPPEAEVPADDPESLLDSFDEAMSARRFDAALIIARKLQYGASEQQAYAMALQATALLGLKQDAEAATLIAKAEELDPSSPEASRVVFLGSLVARRPEFAADALDRLISRAPDIVRQLDWNTMRLFLSNEPKAQERRNEDRRIALARIGYGADTAIGPWRAKDAIDILVRRGDFTDAAELLDDAAEPIIFENILIQTRYEPLWPRVTDLAGRHLEKVRASSLLRAKLQLERSPGNRELLANYVNALRHAGKLDEAIAIREELPATSAEMSLADEKLGWVVNNVALAMHDAGQADAADRLYAMLNDAPMPKEFWRVSMKVNRLELLVLDGKFEKALPLIEPTAMVEGSPYADQLVRRLRYCALISTGQAEEAAKHLPPLLEHARDASGPTIDGLLCAGDFDNAERVAIDALQGEDARYFEQDFVRQLQLHPLTSDDPSVWHGRWQELRARPAIREAFDRLGRDMPPDLLPPDSKRP